MKYVVIAGEASGDELAARLIASLKQQDPQAEFYGIGGTLMQQQGLQSIIAMERISVIGITSILWQIRRLYRTINQTADYINQLQADALITVDAPEFAIRVCRRVRNNQTKKIHYVAPTVWAMRPKRAKIFTQYYDAILTLLPFEPALFNRYKPCAHFVGHDLFFNDALNRAKQDTRQNNIWRANFIKTHLTDQPDAVLIGILLGSRSSEIKFLLPIFVQTAEKILQTQPNAYFIIPSFVKYRTQIAQQMAHLPHMIIDDDEVGRFRAMRACACAIAASGTVSLHLGFLQVPHLVAYRIGKINFAIMRLMISLKYFNMFNILADKKWGLLDEAQAPPIIPEFIQKNCDADNLYHAIMPLLQSEHQQKQLTLVEKLLEKLRPPAIEKQSSDKQAEQLHAGVKIIQALLEK